MVSSQHRVLVPGRMGQPPRWSVASECKTGSWRAAGSGEMPVGWQPASWLRHGKGRSHLRMAGAGGAHPIQTSTWALIR